MTANPSDMSSLHGFLFNAGTESSLRELAPVDTLPDRARRNRFLGFLLHIGIPVGLSLVLNALLIGGMMLCTAFWERQRETPDYSATIAPVEDSLSEAFQFTTPEAVVPSDPATPTIDDSPTDTPDALLDAPSMMDAAPQDDCLSRAFGDGAAGLLGLGAGSPEEGHGGFAGGLGGGRARARAGWGPMEVDANKIVYVVDYSGSILVAVDDLKRKLKHQIGRLTPIQSFNVVLFSGGPNGAPQVRSFSSRLEPVTEESRRNSYAWIDHQTPQGGTEPVAAMKQALALRPEAIFLLSDGEFEDALIDEITAANRIARASISTLVFDEQALSQSGSLPAKMTAAARRLQRLAEANRGQWHIISARDLQAAP